MMNTLTPHLHTYLTGRLRRGEIAPVTAANIRDHLHGFDRSYGNRPLANLGPKAVDRWLEQIAHLAPTTRRCYLSQLRGFSRWMVARDMIRTDITAHVPTIHQPRHVVITLTRAQVGRALAVTPDERGAALLLVLIGCGARCVELERARVEDFDPDGLTIRLTGKAHHERLVPVPTETAEALAAYLDIAGRPAGPLFRTYTPTPRALRASTIGNYVRDWLYAAGVKTRSLDGRSAHAFRRTAGSDVLDESGDIRAVQEMLGHLNLETTARFYLRPVTQAQLRLAMSGRTYRPTTTANELPDEAAA